MPCFHFLGSARRPVSSASLASSVPSGFASARPSAYCGELSSSIPHLDLTSTPFEFFSKQRSGQSTLYLLKPWRGCSRNGRWRHWNERWKAGNLEPGKIMREDSGTIASKGRMGMDTTPTSKILKTSSQLWFRSSTLSPDSESSNGTLRVCLYSLLSSSNWSSWTHFKFLPSILPPAKRTTFSLRFQKASCILLVSNFTTWPSRKGCCLLVVLLRSSPSISTSMAPF